MEPTTLKQINRDIAYYTVNWSRLSEVNKFDILNKVPSVSGIYELYFRDSHKKLVLFYLARVWYGGLRGSIRETTDPLLVDDAGRKKILQENTCFYRYSMVSSTLDMEDILHYFASLKLAPSVVPGHSGRYKDIFLMENSEDTIVTI